MPFIFLNFVTWYIVYRIWETTEYIVNIFLQILGFILADEGYDVSLGNVRGNRYSRKNLNLTTSESKFWMFRYGITTYYDLFLKLNSLYFNSNWSICTVGMKWGYTMFQRWSITLSSKRSNRRSLWYHIARVLWRFLWWLVKGQNIKKKWSLLLL